jgi:hypothetical protein
MKHNKNLVGSPWHIFKRVAIQTSHFKSIFGGNSVYRLLFHVNIVFPEPFVEKTMLC